MFLIWLVFGTCSFTTLFVILCCWQFLFGNTEKTNEPTEQEKDEQFKQAMARVEAKNVEGRRYIEELKLKMAEEAKLI